MAESQAQQGSLQLVLTRPRQHVADDVDSFRLAVAFDVAQHTQRGQGLNLECRVLTES